ncbi:DUF1802 family protein [Synechococcus elongatus]|uniref:DUF1802 family protein n=2 Tax=Synechococcus elongatus TaxID=32046 RepID=Q31KM5_SYNE7|nr:DUF1802 family protein [Synechococcus elongatus]ABB58394.1 conserved hypothetical protein [Synechococcus elongatus PCC 7942 = FACHB-805]AJD57142.1 hypothetical protein M744_04445 [Synechococcus elongatus UTEX 2973]MBD2587116.1 DUF1802 family protein [Synechococcus elongatus FACHB-242]MBD2688187.1 DUF1802 family protein [Synechococcus elongatus FACHB-1061]MBD2706102.1 DUF1802 family protein [Synechococcus elongatus PCC 7942 = FACHB-805]
MVFPPLDRALKEWPAAIAALANGDSILLLRKGGIQEPQGQFWPATTAVWLLPSIEHQQPEALRVPAEAIAHEVPEQLELSVWAEISQAIPLPAHFPLTDLSASTVWTTAFLEQRRHWKPEQPLWLLVLRTYRVPESRSLAWQASYRGCRSWITLAEPLSRQDSEPVLSDRAFADQWQAIAEILQRGGLTLDGLPTAAHAAD